MGPKTSPLRNGVIFSKDKKTEEALRKSRSQRISHLKISNPLPSLRIDDYCEEARISFLNGCFRSCIICSAIAVELMLKHFLIFLSEDWEKTYWEVEIKKIRFYEITKRLRNVNKKLDDSLKLAEWLRKARNEIVAHPFYIGNPFKVKEPGVLEPKELEQQIWACKIMLRDIRKLLQFVESSKRKEIEEKTFNARDEQGRIVEEFSVIDFLEQRRPVRYDIFDFFYWRVIHNELIEEIAFQAYVKMVKMMNALFSINYE